MSQLSPKEYIRTKARTLPIYKCLVTKNWQESKRASVIVMRKHTNGHVTAGFYYIDLMCLGVKGSRYYFNVDEKEILKDLGDAADLYDEEGYSLAHNIIYAGYDFATEYDISPAKEFELTRFILDEDNDNIPILDIEVGDKGKPHLLVMMSNERLDALAQLKKNAGEGNYYYTVAEEQNFEEYFLDNIPVGKLDCLKVLKVETEDLEDDEKVEKRNVIERIYIYSELFTRYLDEEEIMVANALDESWKKKWIAELSYIPLAHMEKYYEEYNRALEDVINDKSGDSFEDRMIRVVNKYAHNPVITALFYEKSILMHKPKITPVAKAHAEKLAGKFPLVKISLALGALIQGSADELLNDIYESESMREIYPGEEIFYMPEFANFALIKMWQRIEEGDIPFAVKYYNLIANSGGKDCILLPMVWSKYFDLLRTLDGDEEEEDENDDNL